MSGLYYQYGNGPQTMMGPDYQTFLRLLEQMRQQSDGSKSQGQGGGMGGMSSLFKMFGGGSGAPSTGDMAGAAGPMVDSPIGGAGGIAGLFA